MAPDAASEVVITSNPEILKGTRESGMGLAVDNTARRLSNKNSRSEEKAKEGLVLQRSKTLDQDKYDLSRSTVRNREPNTLQNMSWQIRTSDYFSDRRRFSLQLPSFKSLGISANYQTVSAQETEHASQQSSGEHTRHCGASSSCKHTPSGFQSTLPPPTPPPEEIPNTSMDESDDSTPTASAIHSCSQSSEPSRGTTPTQESQTGRARPLQFHCSTPAAGSSQLQRLPWLAQASHKMISILGSTCPHDAIQVVSQTLPCQARDSRSRPTFEALLEILQTDLNSSPYITITHAVPQARVMEELPKTPPSTPNFRNEMSDYFSNDQTIFTHAAVVPIYHSHDRANYALAGKLVHHIAAPCSTQVSILERYIPPTMPEEIQDFFGVSTRSYLSDRLSELSTSNGSLLLVYPTHNGGKTFARQYIGPIIDPYLRRFVMLNGLTSEAANLMGNMTAVNHMLEFEEMETRVASLCQNLNNQPATRGPRSAFCITHSEVTSIVLDRPTWLNWYVEQEQSRLRQNLVEYHQEGGRMPEADGNQEVTTGMLTRDFIDGLRKCKDAVGGAAIEVGVFLITRSKIQ